MNKKYRNTDFRNRISLAVVALIVLIVVGLFVVSIIGKRDDASRFSSVETKKSLLAKGMADYLGDDVVSEQNKNECFNTEQGPYDNGRLWCQTSTIFRLGRDLPYSDMGEWFLKAGESIGRPKADEDPFPGYRIVLEEGMSCELQFRDSSGNNYGAAMRIPFDEDVMTAISVSCADRAKAKHYEYID